jgi:hypothetical protein
MRKPILLAGLKAMVILYFAACASVEDYTVAKSVTPVVTRGNWKVNLYMDANNDKTNDFAGYLFTFSGNGDLKATKNGNDINGNWYEDNVSKRVIINLGNTDPMLVNLNDQWDIGDVSNTNVNLENANAFNVERLSITNQ